MECRRGCGACCIAASINSPIPGMPHGKPAGVACVNLDPQTLRCNIWGRPDYPSFCRGFRPCSEVCGSNQTEALVRLARLENLTKPA